MEFVVILFYLTLFSSIDKDSFDNSQFFISSLYIIFISIHPRVTLIIEINKKMSLSNRYSLRFKI